MGNLLSVLIDGELRLYEEQAGVVDEWGRLLIRRGLSHETATRLVLDLAALTGAGDGAEARAVEPVAPLALPAPRQAQRAGRPRGGGIGRQGRIMQELAMGPASAPELRAATGWEPKVVSNALHAAKLAGKVRQAGADQRWVLINGHAPAPKRDRSGDREHIEPPPPEGRSARAALIAPTGRKGRPIKGAPTLQSLMLAELAEAGPLTAAELAGRLGLSRRRASDNLVHAVKAGAATREGHRWAAAP